MPLPIAATALRTALKATGVSTDQITDVIKKAIAFVANAVKLAIIVAVAIFLYRNPPRVGGPHNFQRKSLGDASQVFRTSISKFWHFYGDKMEEWWSGLVQRAATDKEARRFVADVCERWKARGKETVFNQLFLDNNKSSSTSGNIALDVRTGFYRYPGRSFDQDKDRDIILAAGTADLDISDSDTGEKWPRISKTTESGIPVKPELDFQAWFDLGYFDPVQAVDAAELKEYESRMRAVERHDLLVVALPEFVQTLYLENSVFRHVPIADIDAVVAHVEKKGVALDDPVTLPDFMVRYGVKKADEGCLKFAAGQLKETARCLDERLLSRLHGTVASNTVLAKSIARNANPDDLVDLESMDPKNLADAVVKINAEKDTALFFASRALKGWRDVKAASEAISDTVTSGNVNTMEIKAFLRTSTVQFENAVTDLLTCMRLAASDESTDKTSLAIEYTAWHAAIDRFRAIEDDTYDVTLRQLQNLRETRGTSPRESSGPKKNGVYKELYAQYVNAVKCAVYVETYLDDAKQKWNVRYTNQLAAKNFYATYFNDIVQSFWLKYKPTTKGIPRRDCVDCFKPHVSPLGNVYNIESVAEYSVRYWQSRGGIGKTLLNETKRMLSTALRNSLLTCEFSAGFVRKILGEEFDGKGFYGGMQNRVWVYRMSHPVSPVVWGVQDGDWITPPTNRAMIFVWNNVLHGDEVVVEDCTQGGTVIYSRYSAPRDAPFPMHRFMSADEHGNVVTSNKISVDSLDFSGCMHGLQRKQYINLANSASNNTVMGDAVDIDTTTIRKDVMRGELSEADLKQAATDYAVNEGFVAEPKPEADYCSANQATENLDMSTSGIFQIIDVSDPPDRMTLFSKRTVIIISKSARVDDPRYANKRLLVFGFDSATNRTVPVLVDDTPSNRGRAIIILETLSLNTTGGAVLGFPEKGDKSYEYFLGSDALRASVDSPPKKRSFWIFLGLAIASVFLPFTIPYTSIVTSILTVATIATGVKAFADERNMKLMGKAIDTGQVIENVLNGSQKNPFLDPFFRYMLVLEKPGIWPEFSLVPYTKPSKTIGSEEPEPNKSTKTKIVPRDYQSGSSRVILIPARNSKPMFTEHTPDNFSRIAIPFYIYAPHKRMFLTPIGNGNPVWVNTNTERNDKSCTVDTGTRFADSNVISGVMPGRCVKPFYIYEMMPNDFTSVERAAKDEEAKQ